jgi:hypothetical protein
VERGRVHREGPARLGEGRPGEDVFLVRCEGVMVACSLSGATQRRREGLWGRPRERHWETEGCHKPESA